MLSGPRLREETGMYAPAVTTRSTGNRAVDETLGIELFNDYAGVLYAPGSGSRAVALSACRYGFALKRNFCDEVRSSRDRRRDLT